MAIKTVYEVECDVCNHKMEGTGCVPTGFIPLSVTCGCFHFKFTVCDRCLPNVAENRIKELLKKLVYVFKEKMNERQWKKAMTELPPPPKSP